MSRSQQLEGWGCLWRRRRDTGLGAGKPGRGLAWCQLRVFLVIAPALRDTLLAALVPSWPFRGLPPAITHILSESVRRPTTFGLSSPVCSRGFERPLVTSCADIQGWEKPRRPHPQQGPHSEVFFDRLFLPSYISSNPHFYGHLLIAKERKRNKAEDWIVDFLRLGVQGPSLEAPWHPCSPLHLLRPSCP